MNKYILKSIFYSMLALVTVLFGFSFAREVSAQSINCRVGSEGWYLNSSPNTAVTSGPAGTYTYKANIVSNSGGACVNKTIPFKLNRDDVQGVSQATKNTGTTGNVSATNINAVAGSRYNACFNFGSGWVCGQSLTINGGSSPGGGNPGGATVVNADCDGDLPVNGVCVDNNGNPTGKAPSCPSPLVYPGSGTVCVSSGSGSVSGTTTFTPTGGDCGKLIDSIGFTADGPNKSKFTSVIDMVPHLCTIQSLLGFILNTLFLFSGVIAVIFLILGGYRYMTSNGSEEAINAGKKTITYAIIGLVVIVMSSAIVNLILSLLNK